MKHNVKSSSIKSVEETGRGSIIVEFNSGGVKYEYFDVPLSIIKEFVQAPSVGKYFNQNIRHEYRNEPRS